MRWLYLLLMTICLNVYAHDDSDIGVYPLSGEVHFGGVANTGNSDNTNVNGKLNFNYETDRWDNTLFVDGNMNTANNKKTAEKVESKAAFRYNLTPRDYLYTKAHGIYDRFSTFDIVVKEGVGYGRRLIDMKKHKLTVEVGPGSTHNRVAGAKNYETFFVLNTDAYYEYRFNKYNSFKQFVGVDWGSVNTRTESLSAIKARITDKFSVVMSYQVLHDSTIPPGSTNRRNTDTISKIAIVYEF